MKGEKGGEVKARSERTEKDAMGGWETTGTEHHRALVIPRYPWHPMASLLDQLGSVPSQPGSIPLRVTSVEINTKKKSLSTPIIILSCMALRGSLFQSLPTRAYTPLRAKGRDHTP